TERSTPMNGIHDMGGMQDMGPIRYEKNEPVFHAAWEGRIYAMSSAVGATGKLRLGLRPPIESIPPADYLRMSYYELWLTSLTERLVASNLVTRDAIESAPPAPGRAPAAIALSPTDAVAAVFRTPAMR